MASENMLQVVLDGLTAAERSMQPLVRAVLVGEPMDHHPAADWEKWCATFVKEANASEKAITGLLLTVSTGWIMAIEGTHAATTAFLRAIAGQKGLLYKESKVIHHAEDITKRCFQAWGAKAVSAARNNYGEFEGQGMLADLLGETVIGMLKIGGGVGEMSAPELQKIDSWESNFPDIPSNERVGQYLELEEVPTLSDFMSIFEAPVDIDMQADRVWPPERPMVY